MDLTGVERNGEEIRTTESYFELINKYYSILIVSVHC